MATQTFLIDDIDGKTTEGVETVRFAFDGNTYEVDLGADNYYKLVKALEPFVAAARRTPGSTAAPKSKKQKTLDKKVAAYMADYDKEAFKTWATENDIALGRGRRSPELVQRFLTETTPAATV